MKKTLSIISIFLFPLYAQLVPFNGYIDSDPPISGSYLIQVSMSNSNGQSIWSENFNNHEIVGGYYSLVLGENGSSDLSLIDFSQSLYLEVNIPTLSFNESDIPLYSTFSSIQSSKDQSEIITVSGHTPTFDYVADWAIMLEVDITIPEQMMICSFGNISGGGLYATDMMLQLSIYSENYSQFYAFSNPWGNSASSYHVLPEGTYHIVLYGANQSGGSPVSDVNLHAFALPLNNRQESNVRIGPFEPYPNNNLPDVKELLNKIK